MKLVIAVAFWMLYMLPACHAQLSSHSFGCESRLIHAEMQIFPKQAMNLPPEEAVKYVTRDLKVYALKQAWGDYQTETRLTQDKVCLAEWIIWIQGSSPSILNDAGVPIQPDDSLARIKEALGICAAKRGNADECESLQNQSAKEQRHRIEANILGLELLHGPSDSGGTFTFHVTNRSKSKSLLRIYVPLMMKNDKYSLEQKRAQLLVPELLPGHSVTIAMTEIAGWKDALLQLIKANNLQDKDDINIEASLGDVSFRVQGAPQPSDFPIDWFLGE
jgi:hypothetical protein